MIRKLILFLTIISTVSLIKPMGKPEGGFVKNPFTDKDNPPSGPISFIAKLGFWGLGKVGQAVSVHGTTREETLQEIEQAFQTNDRETALRLMRDRGNLLNNEDFRFLGLRLLNTLTDDELAYRNQMFETVITRFTHCGHCEDSRNRFTDDYIVFFLRQMLYQHHRDQEAIENLFQIQGNYFETLLRNISNELDNRDLETARTLLHNYEQNRLHIIQQGIYPPRNQIAILDFNNNIATVLQDPQQNNNNQQQANRFRFIQVEDEDPRFRFVRVDGGWVIERNEQNNNNPPQEARRMRILLQERVHNYNNAAAPAQEVQQNNDIQTADNRFRFVRVEGGWTIERTENQNN